MVSIRLAQRLRELGLRWDPAPGDHFVLPHRGMDDEVFVVSNMTVDVHDFPGGRVIGFNGTTEWALDSVEQREALWLPREDQLRDRLGDAFRRLERVDGRWRVVVDVKGTEETVESADPADAYALSLSEVMVAGLRG